MYRLLLDADAPGNAGGSVTPPTPAAPPHPATIAAPAPKSPESPPTVTLSASDYQAFLGLKDEIARRDAAEAERVETERIAREKLLVEKGRFEELHKSTSERLGGEIKATREKLDAAESKIRRTLLDKELTSALAGFDLVPGALPQLSRLYRDDFSVVDSGDGYAVQAKATAQQVADYLRAELAKPENEHFLKAAGKGGVGAGGGERKDPNPNPEPPKSLGELWAAEWKAKRAQGPSFGLGGKIGGR